MSNVSERAADDQEQDWADTAADKAEEFVGYVENEDDEAIGKRVYDLLANRGDEAGKLTLHDRLVRAGAIVTALTDLHQVLTEGGC